MNHLTRASAAELADALGRKEVSSVEVVQAHLDRIEAVDHAVHSYLHVDAEGALATARAVDDARAAGDTDLHVMAGVPIAVKDVMTTKGLPTTCGSRILAGWVPPYDSTVVAKIRAAGMPILGKTNLDEFAMGSSTEHSGYGPSHNPWDLDRIPGGSASRRPSPARSAPSRPTAACLAMAWWPWPAVSTRPDPAPAPCSTRPCCTR